MGQRSSEASHNTSKHKSISQVNSQRMLLSFFNRSVVVRTQAHVGQGLIQLNLKYVVNKFHRPNTETEISIAKV